MRGLIEEGLVGILFLWILSVTCNPYHIFAKIDSSKEDHGKRISKLEGQIVDFRKDNVTLLKFMTEQNEARLRMFKANILVDFVKVDLQTPKKRARQKEKGTKLAPQY